MLLFVLAALVGGLIGAIGLSLVTVLLYALLEREAFQDGQFGMVFMFTVPFGVLLGSAISIVMRVRGRSRAAWLAMASGGAILSFATLIVAASAGSRGGGFGELARTLLSLWIAPSWIAAAVLMLWGMVQLTIRRGA